MRECLFARACVCMRAYVYVSIVWTKRFMMERSANALIHNVQIELKQIIFSYNIIF